MLAKAVEIKKGNVNMEVVYVLFVNEIYYIPVQHYSDIL